LKNEEVLTIDTDAALQKVNLAIDKNKGVPLHKRRAVLSIAAGLALLFAAFFAVQQFSGAETMLESHSTLSEGKYIDLPDRSRIWMEPNTSVSFANNFEKERNIRVDGEIFIDVFRDVNKPFTVLTDNLKVQVLGTSFIVSDKKEEEQALVSVISGKVAVSSKTNSEIITIEKGESVSLDKVKSKLLLLEVPPDINHLYKYTKIIQFENTRLESLVQTLEKVSGIQIKLENSDLKDCIFTGEFSNKTILEILEALKPIYKFNIYSENKQYLIREGSCNK